MSGIETADGLPVDRWIVSGQLRTLSVMEIHTGDTEWQPPAGTSPGPGEPEPSAEGPSIIAIDLDVDAQPVIPATAMKGCLRALLVEEFGDGQLRAITDLFGDRPAKGRSGNDPEPDPSELYTDVVR